jgi:hypothetical protein
MILATGKAESVLHYKCDKLKNHVYEGEAVKTKSWGEKNTFSLGWKLLENILLS